MSEDLQRLHQIDTASSPAPGARIALAVLIALLYGAATSPLVGTWALILLAVALVVGAVYLTVSLRRRGVRSNNYAPMRSDDDTPASLGGNLTPPKSSNDQAQTLLTCAVPTIYVAAWVGNQSSSETVGWIWSGGVTVMTLLVMWRVLVLEAESAPGYVPLSTVFASEPDWTPGDDVDAVASVLYAARAVPAGRRLAVELRERKGTDTVERWVALTEGGREAVKAEGITRNA